MSQYDKLIERIKNNPKDVSFNDLEKVVLKNGYVLKNVVGSHFYYMKDDKNDISIVKPHGKKGKKVHLKGVLAIIEELNL